MMESHRQRALCKSLIRNLTLFPTDECTITSWKHVAHVYNLAKYWKEKRNPQSYTLLLHSWMCEHISFIGNISDDTAVAWICYNTCWYKKKTVHGELLNKMQPNLPSELFFSFSEGKCSPLISAHKSQVLILQERLDRKCYLRDSACTFAHIVFLIVKH